MMGVFPSINPGEPTTYMDEAGFVHLKKKMVRTRQLANSVLTLHQKLHRKKTVSFSPLIDYSPCGFTLKTDYLLLHVCDTYTQKYFIYFYFMKLMMNNCRKLTPRVLSHDVSSRIL